MNDKLSFDSASDTLNEKDLYPYSLDLNNRKNSNRFQLTEVDFYPPSDDRVLESYVEDIEDGENFADYCEYIFELLEEEGYYE